MRHVGRIEHVFVFRIAPWPARRKPPAKIRRPRMGRPSLIAWSGQRVSNPRPTAWEAVALPTELCPR